MNLNEVLQLTKESWQPIIVTLLLVLVAFSTRHSNPWAHWPTAQDETEAEPEHKHPTEPAVRQRLCLCIYFLQCTFQCTFRPTVPLPFVFPQPSQLKQRLSSQNVERKFRKAEANYLAQDYVSP